MKMGRRGTDYPYPGSHLLFETPAPESAGFVLGHYTAFSVHLEVPEIQDVKRAIREANIDRSRKGAFDDGMQAPIGGVDASDRATDTRASRRGHGYFIAEKRHEELSFPARESRWGDIELDRRSVGREAQQRLFGRWQFVMVGEREFRHRASHRTIGGVGDGVATDEVGPAIPRALAHLKEQIGHVADGSAAPVIRALVNRQQAAIWQESQAIGVANAPGHQFEIAAI